MVKKNDNDKDTTPETKDVEATPEVTDKADKATEDLMKAAEASKKGFFVEEGKSITSRKGVKGPGDKIVAADIAAGDAGKTALSALVKKGLVKEVR